MRSGWKAGRVKLLAVVSLMSLANAEVTAGEVWDVAAPAMVEDDETYGSYDYASMPADFEAIGPKSKWDYGSVGIMPTWFNGVMTYQTPDQLTWNEDGTVTSELTFPGQHVDGTGDVHISGTLQVTQRNKGLGRWGTISRSPKPTGTLAFFLYERYQDAELTEGHVELDWEWVGDDHSLGKGWQLNVHMPQTDGSGRLSLSDTGATGVGHIPMTDAEVAQWHKYEVELTTTEANFYLDDVLRFTVTPADMPSGITWKTNANLQMFLSNEAHGAWAGHKTGKAGNWPSVWQHAAIKG